MTVEHSVGDVVMIRKYGRYWTPTTEEVSNPINMRGIVKTTSNEDPEHPVRVDWENGESNVYQHYDLVGQYDEEFHEDYYGWVARTNGFSAAIPDKDKPFKINWANNKTMNIDSLVKRVNNSPRKLVGLAAALMWVAEQMERDGSWVNQRYMNNV